MRPLAVVAAVVVCTVTVAVPLDSFHSRRTSPLAQRNPELAAAAVVVAVAVAAAVAAAVAVTVAAVVAVSSSLWCQSAQQYWQLAL